MTDEEILNGSPIGRALVSFTKSANMRAILTMVTVTVVVCIALVVAYSITVRGRVDEVIGRFDALERKVDGVQQTTDATQTKVAETQETLEQGTDLEVRAVEPPATAKPSAAPTALVLRTKPRQPSTASASTSAVMPIPAPAPSSSETPKHE